MQTQIYFPSTKCPEEKMKTQIATPSTESAEEMMETQIATPSTICAEKTMETQIFRRTTLGDFKVSKRQMNYIASLLKDPENIEMLKNELETHHSKGNEYFKRSEWDKAVERYSDCLRFGLPFALTGIVAGSEIKRDILAVVASNRTQVFLNQRLWEIALFSAEEALTFDPNNLKSLCRKAKALESLQDYKRACSVLEYALVLSPNNEVIKDRLDQCKTLHHQSVTGEYDLPNILCTGGPAPIFGDFVGPVEIKWSTYSGRGLFLTEDVHPGKLLLVTNAVAFGGSDRNDRWEQFSSLADEMHYLCHSSQRLLHQFHYLQSIEFSRQKQIPSMELFIPGSNWFPDPNSKLEIPSRDELFSVALTNSFDARPSILPLSVCQIKSKLVAPNQFGLIGIWTLPSFFNHSCVPNCSTENFGKAMFIRASETMKAGTELTISYVPTDEVDRNKIFRHWNFNCKCERCCQDQRIRHLIQELLDETKQLLSAPELQSRKPSLDAFPKFCRLVARIEEVIQNLPMQLGERQKNWIRFTFQKIYSTKLRFEALMTPKDRIDLLKLLHRGYESINTSIGGPNLQLAVTLLYSVESEYGRNSVEYQEARGNVVNQFTKYVGNVKEEEIEKMLKTGFSEIDLWYV